MIDCLFERLNKIENSTFRSDIFHVPVLLLGSLEHASFPINLFALSASPKLLHSRILVLPLDLVHGLLLLNDYQLRSVALHTSRQGLEFGQIEFEEIFYLLEHPVAVRFLLDQVNRDLVIFPLEKLGIPSQDNSPLFLSECSC